MIISFISRKGGTGKTTNVMQLATTLASQKKRVVVIETDTNYTLTTLRKMELFKAKKTEKGIVTGMSVNNSMDAIVSRTVTFQGTGTLTIGTV